MTEARIAAIIVAAGRGERSGLDIPKQFARLAGRALVAHAYAALAAHPRISRVIVAIGDGQEEAAREALHPVSQEPELVPGGATRRDSVRAALEHLFAQDEATHVLIHDAARPLLPAGVIDRLIAALEAGAEGAIPALPVVDTLVYRAPPCGDGGYATLGEMGGAADRDALVHVQTPQAFRLSTIIGAHRNCPEDAAITDDAGLLRAQNLPVALVEGDAMLGKLTYPADFVRAEAMLAGAREPRTGLGYDVHRLVEDKPLWLCGVEIPYSHGLSGHSDADVAIHALVDALLGALAEGDIGSHFPPSDPQWKGAPSQLFLAFARDRIVARGGRLLHADVTIICEAPKIGPHREAMRARLAELLAVDPARLSVKATTTEKLGFTGRREGIAAQAVATVSLPIL